MRQYALLLVLLLANPVRAEQDLYVDMEFADAQVVRLRGIEFENAYVRLTVGDAPVGSQLCAQWEVPGDSTQPEQCEDLPSSGTSYLFAKPESFDPRSASRMHLVLKARGVPAAPVATFTLFPKGRHTASVNGHATPAFPWPPPKPTTSTVLDRAWLPRNAQTLGAAAGRLEQALIATGFLEHSYYSVPGGFALVTRLEQIRADGALKPANERWSTAVPRHKVFNLADYLVALFTAPQGHYRVIVFVVTDRAIVTGAEGASEDEITDWLGEGMNRLPADIANAPFTAAHAASALIYQIRKTDVGTPEINPEGAPPARTQLERAGIVAALSH